jgi:hypothetical protein
MLKSRAELAVDLFPVSNSDDQNDQPVIFNLADDPEIAHLVPCQPNGRIARVGRALA